MADIDKLRRLHDIVKDHPARLGIESSWDNYVAVWQELLETFHTALKEESWYKGSGAWIFFHDVNESIRLYKQKKPWSWFIPIYLEVSLSYIHRYIETGQFKEFQAFYGGSGMLRSSNRVTLMRFDEGRKKFYPCFTKKELEDEITEIKEYAWAHGFERFGPYSRESLEWREELLVKGEPCVVDHLDVCWVPYGG